MGVAVPAVRVRQTFVKRVALLAVPTLIAANLAVVSSTRAAEAGGSLDAVNVQVLGGPVGNITSSPLSLTPTFAQTTTDYVLRCHSGINTIQLTLSAASAGKIAVGKNRGASITIEENLVENQALIVSGPARPGSSEASGRAQAGHSDSSQAWGHAQYWIRCLPHDFPELSVTRVGNPLPGWYLTGNLNSAAGSGTYAMVLDVNGTPVWYRKSAGIGVQNVTPLGHGSIAWGSNGGAGFGADPNAAYEVYNLETQTTSWLATPTPPTDFHELAKISNGDLMMMSTPLRQHIDLTGLGLPSDSTVIDCLVQEVDSQRRPVWEWRASDHLSAAESTRPAPNLVLGQFVYDTFHCNSVDTDNHGDLLLSARNTDAVYFIRRSDGKVVWKLGGKPFSKDGGQVLSITGDPEGSIHAQHDARFQPNGDVSLYDNEFGTFLPARGVEYHIDSSAGTAAMTWSFASPDGQNSFATGSFRRLYGGNDNVIAWGVKPDTLFTEVDETGRVILSVRFPSGEFAYRVAKVLPAAFDHNLLRQSAGLPPAIRPVSAA